DSSFGASGVVDTRASSLQTVAPLSDGGAWVGGSNPFCCGYAHEDLFLLESGGAIDPLVGDSDLLRPAARRSLHQLLVDSSQRVLAVGGVLSSRYWSIASDSIA